MAKPKNPTTELGVSTATYSQGFNWEEYIPALRGRQAIRKYREMRDNDPIIGAVLTAMDMMLRAIDWRIEAVDDTPQADEAKAFVEEVFSDMDHTFEEFISEVLSFLPYGFSVFEVVYKTRQGPEQNAKERRSAFSDGMVGIRKLASRAQWTIEEIQTDAHGEILGFRQDTLYNGAQVQLPMDKALLFRTASINNEPTGRSVLRNAYLPYHYSTAITTYESIAIERELNGLPVARIPSEYLGSNASASQQAFRAKIEKMVRDVKFNEQGYVVLPSDRYQDANGAQVGEYKVAFELMASNGSRDIDTTKVITRHQQDMARTVLADFLMLGQGERGSFALSKDKSDLFLRSLEGYAQNIAATINRQLMPPLWELNGMNMGLMPKVVPGDVAPVDLEELGGYIESLSRSGFTLFDPETEDHLRAAGGLPETPDEDPDLLGQSLPDDPTLPADPEDIEDL